MGKRFSCRIIRPVLQSTVIEIEAENPNLAAEQALKLAASVHQSEWKTEDFNKDDYTSHVQDILEHDKPYYSDDKNDTELENFQTCLTKPSVKYLLLAAKTHSGEGSVLAQPWFDRIEPILQADLCQDWGDTISYICENDGCDDATNCVTSLVTDYDNVIPFDPASRKDKGHILANRKDSEDNSQ